jgi:homocysteine S-methyltransferase
MIVDGGLGLELERRGFAFSTGLWSGEALLARPDLVAAIHRDYLAAGAEVLETATYQLSHGALRQLGYDEAQIDGTFARGVTLAREAIDAHLAALDAHLAANGSTTSRSVVPIVAAALGPFGATVGDGSEYSSKQHLTRTELYAFHVERAQSVARAKPDVFLFETIPTRAEALVVAEVARDLELERVWISLSCADGAHTYGGDRVADVAAALDTFAGVEVIGVNCSPPAAIASLIRELRSATGKPILVCPNRGQHWENVTHALVGEAAEAEFMRHVPDWLELGVTHIGGCCGVGPNLIGAIASGARAQRTLPLEPLARQSGATPRPCEFVSASEEKHD